MGFSGLCQQIKNLNKSLLTFSYPNPIEKSWGKNSDFVSKMQKYKIDQELILITYLNSCTFSPSDLKIIEL